MQWVKAISSLPPWLAAICTLLIIGGLLGMIVLRKSVNGRLKKVETRHEKCPSDCSDEFASKGETELNFKYVKEELINVRQKVCDLEKPIHFVAMKNGWRPE
jgi:5-bromo-4-chloroindolyl phosphate hydrolysis protein